jgi:hypothetical protein
MFQTLRQDNDVAVPRVTLEPVHQLTQGPGRTFEELHENLSAEGEKARNVVALVVALGCFQDAIQIRLPDQRLRFAAVT